MVDLRKNVDVQDVKNEQQKKKVTYYTCVVCMLSGKYLPWQLSSEQIEWGAHNFHFSGISYIVKKWEGQNEELWEIAYNACRYLNH